MSHVSDGSDAPDGADATDEATAGTPHAASAGEDQPQRVTTKPSLPVFT